MISKEEEVANTLNCVLSNIVKNLNIPEYHVNALHYMRSNQPNFKAILKYKNRPSIDASFYFSQVDKRKLL